MYSDTQSGRDGMLAGGIAAMAMLLAMQLLSRVIGPQIMLTEYFAPLTFSKLIGLTGEFARFLTAGGPNLPRVVIFLVFIYVLVGAGLGRWANSGADSLPSRSMQAGALILFLTLGLLYIADRQWLEFFFQETAITIALSCLVFVFVLNRLLGASNSSQRWRIGGVISLMSVIVIVHDVITR